MQTRPPTHAEAVDWLVRNGHERAYCRDCLILWRGLLGDTFMRKVANEARAKIDGQNTFVAFSRR